MTFLPNTAHPIDGGRPYHSKVFLLALNSPSLLFTPFDFIQHVSDKILRKTLLPFLYFFTAARLKIVYVFPVGTIQIAPLAPHGRYAYPHIDVFHF
jgi:hypothetical protein